MTGARHRRQHPRPQIVATGLLVQAQAELRQHRQQVIEDIALDSFVIGPRRGAGEAVDLQRHALGGGLHLADHAGHVRLDVRVAFQVGQRVGAEGAEVGHAPAVGRQLRAVTLSLVPGPEFGLLAADVIGEQVHLGHAHFFVVTQEAHAAGIDEQAALDAPPARGLHAAPVFERFGHQAPGGDGDDGFIERR